jgi:hypothetical protein
VITLHHLLNGALGRVDDYGGYESSNIKLSHQLKTSGRIEMKKTNKISHNTLGLLIGLVVSVWWIFMGLESGFRFEAPDSISYLLTLAGYRHTIMTTAALILIPLCAREIRWGFILAILLGSINLLLLLLHISYMLISKPPGFESQMFGPIVWLVMQIPIIFFGYRALKE